ncbi:MAG: autotransporter-associated beta strand repeat-containing protein [Kiritimatiellae bacterium]|nr:autotransporter-associated beta strand repeat-containing protein [Kiritimatiellia bacterium]
MKSCVTDTMSHVFARSCCHGILAVVLALAVTRPNAAFAADYALTFANGTQYVSTPAKVSTASFTFEAWVRVTSYAAQNWVFTQYIGGNAGRMVGFIENTNACFFLGGKYIRNTAAVPLNTWTHFAVIRSGSTGSIYVNGVLYATDTIPTAALPSTGITIGGHPSTGWSFHGQIADVRAWGVARSQAQIAASMNTRLSGMESGLVGYWPVNDGTGISVNERVAGAHGTLTGTPLPAWFYSADLPVFGMISGTWNSTSGGNWSAAANWLDGTLPNGDGHLAFFTNQTAAALAVTNDLSPLLLGGMVLTDVSGCAFSGSPITFTNAASPAYVSALSGTHVFDLPIVLGGGGLAAGASAPAAISFPNVLSGSGALAINAAPSGGGWVTLSGANTYTGPTSLGCGTLAVNALADGGAASPIGASSSSATNLLLGPGTFYYSGPAAATDRGYTVAAGSSPVRAAVLRLDTDLTIGGQCLASSGAFLKTGPGTLRYTYAGAQTLAIAQGNGDALLDTDANGDSPTTGFHGYTISNGKVIMGAAGQTNLINNGRITVGHYTTTAAGAETAGELQIDGGALVCNDTLGIGRGNGTTTTAPGGLSSRMTVNGGTVTCAILSTGFVGGAPAATFNARPVVDINAGLVDVTGDIRVGESQGSVATLNLRGGTLRCANQGWGMGINIGGSSGGVKSNTSGTGLLNLSGTGVLDIALNVALGLYGSGSTGTVHLMGGTLVAGNIVRGEGVGTVRFNGGTLMPRTEGRTLSGLTAATVSTNGAIIDTSLANYTIGQDLLHDPDAPATDGGLVKLGTNTLTIASYGSTYTGPTVVSNGTLCIAGGLPANNALSVAADGEALIGGSTTQTVTAASLALEGGGLGFAFALDGSANDRLTVLSSPVFGSGSGVAFYQLSTRLPFIKNGTYTLITYTGADPAVANLSCANPVYGKTYTFAASGGTLTVTIGNDTAAACLWNLDGSGLWGTGSNWTVAPASAAGSQVRFDSAITAPATVTAAGETVGEIYLNNAAAYTLGGSGLTLDNGSSPALISVESGAHVVSAPLTLNGDTTLDLWASTALTLDTVNGATSTLTAQGNGTLALSGPASVQTLSVNVSEVGVSNTLTLAAPVALQRSITVRPALSTTTTVSGVVSGTADLTKAGSSTLALSAENTYIGRTVVAAGTLTASTLANGGAASSIGASSAWANNWTLGPATFHYTGPSATIDRGYYLAAGNNPVRAAVMRLDNDLTIGGQCTLWFGAFLKTGPGTLRYTYPGAQTLANVENGDGLLNIGANGDSPTTGFWGFNIAQGKIIMGAPGQTNTINNRITIGLYTTATGAETTGELELVDGVLNCNTTLSVGRGNGTTVTAPGGISSRLTVNGGIANVNLIGVGYWGAAPANAFNARPVIDINAGTVNVASDARIGDSKGSVATLNVRGGTLRCLGQNGAAGLTLGGAQDESGTGTLNLMGTGVVDIVHNVKLGAGWKTPGSGTLNLAGGMLIASNIVRGAGTGYVRFNGGTFFPRVAGRTMTGLTAATVSTNGAVFDTSLADGYTVEQNLLHDSALEAEDGGLVKLGTHSLSLTGAGNTFNGPVAVRAGLLRARLGGTNDLAVAADAFFDALGDRCAVGDLTGNGTLTNGVIALTGALDAGTNNAPAGARMTVQNLGLVKGSTFVCTWSTNSVGKITNDFVTVTGTLAPEGAGFIDLGRTEENPIPMPFTAAIMSYGVFSGNFAGWKAVNTGLPAGKAVATLVTASDGVVTLEVCYGGTLFMLR